MIDLYNAATNQLLGTITDADLKVLVDALEEESAQDQDYYIDTAIFRTFFGKVFYNIVFN